MSPDVTRCPDVQMSRYPDVQMSRCPDVQATQTPAGPGCCAGIELLVGSRREGFVLGGGMGKVKVNVVNSVSRYV
jgi:hypothetical protein